MRLIIKNQIFPVILLSILPFLFVSSTHADAFKCIDKKGNIVFQDSACTDDEKETLIEIQKKIVSVDNILNIQCEARCDNRRAICVTRLGDGARNTGKNLLRCEKVKEVCYLRCAKVDNGGELDTFVNIERSNYERELRREQSLKSDAKYQKNKKKRIAQWDQKREQRHCRRYERKLAKVKAQWKRVQEKAKGWTPREETYHRKRIENAEDVAIIECK
ncbi:MAG: DUF4124 domain-containing protein [Cocleimonas sp.]|nr:DUF4124 domain-containing protein [Cocleimonas sp.]